MDFLNGHKKKTNSQKRKIIRCNIKQNTNFDEMLEDNIYRMSSAKKQNTKKSLRRKSSEKIKSSRIESYIYSTKADHFSSTKILSSNLEGRRVSYCELAEDVQSSADKQFGLRERQLSHLSSSNVSTIHRRGSTDCSTIGNPSLKYSSKNLVTLDTTPSSKVTEPVDPS